ncbi:HAD family hydrolase [Siansivirga zeaxanthinifaciens]|uniref:ABC transporter ATP-binding protein n=1 Tax=Siansivirga zeaxanthinifaciens CC-SAMT-1 TaxID=1454006 RepID=A0A0C5VXS3_9FLAO|nr:HAD family phosphatase [Siansivirga zeaxanthinifaciens]AJR03916.1 ABC transporter ATP-binding protein [Siansivirga zeaxanthinifaciens CC-SAMT-1]
MLQAVIFDMDGVIIESEPLHYKAYHKMFEDVNIEVSAEFYESLTGKSTLNVCKQICDAFNLSESPETLVSIKRKHYDDIFENDKTFDLIEGVLDVIKNYHDNELTLILASSASMPSIERIFKRFDLNKYFKAKLSGAELKASKPHPEIFIKAAEASGFKTEECIVIEDSTNGIIAAKSAGIFCVGYDSFHSKNQDYSKADLVVKDFSEIHYNRIKDLL